MLQGTECYRGLSVTGAIVTVISLRPVALATSIYNNSAQWRNHIQYIQGVVDGPYTIFKEMTRI